MAQVDLTDVTDVGVEPGTLPDTMAAWVIRQEREGEPVDAFQLEQIEVPQPGAFEVIVRVMAAGVNYNNVWAALGQPVAPSRSTSSPFSAEETTPTDCAPVILQSCVANTPRPPAAPQINTLCPAWRSHCVISMRYAVK